MRAPFRLLVPVFAGLLLAGLSPATSARWPVEPRPIGPDPLVRLSVIDRDHGGQLPLHRHRGTSWVAGTPGHRYTVRLSNNRNRRVLVVLSVDGVNAVTGETADPAQAGYVLAPWQSVEITGWRKSLKQTAGFVFTDHHNSYASRTGRPRNVGVIGVAVFEEARHRHHHRPVPFIGEPIGEAETARQNAEDAAEVAPEAARGAADIARHGNRQRLGTGHGEREWSPASRTHFTRASRHPAQVNEIRYDTRSRLVALGIIPRRGPDHGYTSTPRAFPGGFVPDPPRR